MGRYSSTYFTIALVSMFLRLLVDRIALDMLRTWSVEEYSRTGKPNFLWSGNAWFVYFRYLLKAKYKSIKNKKIRNLFVVSHILLVVMLFFIALFFMSIFV